jgi:hypothetical protein
LGIVLSDEQIQQADRTADKIEALETVLKAKIAGYVADNADSILNLADAIEKLASVTVGALGQVRAFFAAISTDYSIPALIDKALHGGIPSNASGIGAVGHSVTLQLPPASSPAKKGASANIGQFLGTGGGGGGRHHGAAAETAPTTLSASSLIRSASRISSARISSAPKRIFSRRRKTSPLITSSRLR